MRDSLFFLSSAMRKNERGERKTERKKYARLFSLRIRDHRIGTSLLPPFPIPHSPRLLHGLKAAAAGHGGLLGVLSEHGDDRSAAPTAAAKAATAASPSGNAAQQLRRRRRRRRRQSASTADASARARKGHRRRHPLLRCCRARGRRGSSLP